MGSYIEFLILILIEWMILFFENETKNWRVSRI